MYFFLGGGGGGGKGVVSVVQSIGLHRNANHPHGFESESANITSTVGYRDQTWRSMH